MQQCLLAARKYLLIKRHSHGRNSDLPQVAALENLPFRIFANIGGFVK